MIIIFVFIINNSKRFINNIWDDGKEKTKELQWFIMTEQMKIYYKNVE